MLIVRPRRLVEQTLAVLLAAAIVMPLSLTVIRNARPRSKVSRWLDGMWIGHPSLHGVTTPTPDVPLTWRSVRSGEFQKRKAREFDESFAGREALIRWTNELWFRLFHDTANAASIIAVGEHDVLFGKTYLREYFLTRNSKTALQPWVKDLRQLQDFCRSIGMGFVIALVPGKPSIYPEETPRAWRHRYDPQPRAYVLLKELFRENGIVFVDGVDLVAREKRKGPPVPLFPKGGVHWNQRAAWIVANAVQARFAEQSKPTAQIEILGSRIVNQPKGTDGDSLRLMNLVHPFDYPCEEIAIKPSATSKTGHMNIAVVGDSFCWPVLEAFAKSGQFSEISFYFWYRQFKTHFVDKQRVRVREPALPLDFDREIFAADCLLLELNEATAVSGEHHLSVFIKDALAHLPDPSAPKPPFRAD